MSLTLDLRGLSCPEPSELTRLALRRDAPAELRVLVDDPAALEHLTRLAPRLGYTATASAKEDHDEVVLVRSPA